MDGYEQESVREAPVFGNFFFFLAASHYYVVGGEEKEMRYAPKDWHRTNFFIFFF